jgi:hypothetical protein
VGVLKGIISNISRSFVTPTSPANTAWLGNGGSNPNLTGRHGLVGRYGENDVGRVKWGENGSVTLKLEGRYGAGRPRVRLYPSP